MLFLDLLRCDSLRAAPAGRLLACTPLRRQSATRPRPLQSTAIQLIVALARQRPRLLLEEKLSPKVTDEVSLRSSAERFPLQISVYRTGAYGAPWLPLEGKLSKIFDF